MPHQGLTHAVGFLPAHSEGFLPAHAVSFLLTLKKGWEFDFVFRTGFRVQGELVRLLLLRGAEGVKAGYAVGKRQGKAHVRNRGRRVLREAFRRVVPYIEPNVTLVLSLRDKGLNAKATEVYDDLVKILRRQGLLRPFEKRDWNAPC